MTDTAGILPPPREPSESEARHAADNPAEGFDISNLTLGEISYVEDLAGLPISAIADPEQKKGKALAALAYIIKRRSNPQFTFKDAEGLTMAEVTALIGDGQGGEDPKE